MGPVLVVHWGIAHDDRPGDVSFFVLNFSTFFFPAQVIICLVAMGSNISVF